MKIAIVVLLMLLSVVGFMYFSSKETVEEVPTTPTYEYVEKIPLYYNVDEPDKFFTRDKEGNFVELKEVMEDDGR